ncbi:hypothetical protein [Streptomyces avidinii]
MTVASLVVGGFLAEAGSEVWRASGRVVEFLRRKFGGDQAAVSALQECQEDPSSEASRGTLAEAIDRHLQGDVSFRDELLALLESEGGSQAGVVNSGIVVTDQANVGKAVQISRVQGDVSF